MSVIIQKHEQYLNWLCGADHSLTDQDILELRGLLFSSEADDIQSIAQTVLGAGA